MLKHRKISKNIPAYLLSTVYKYNLSNPTVEHVLCHIFFVLGNGLHFDDDSLVELSETPLSRKYYYEESVKKLKDQIRNKEKEAKSYKYISKNYYDTIKRLAQLQATRKMERYIISDFRVDNESLASINWYIPTEYALIHSKISENSEWYKIFKMFVQSAHDVIKHLEIKNLMYTDFYERIPDDKLRWKPIIEEYFTMLFPEEAATLKKAIAKIKQEEEEKRARFK